MEEEPVDLRSSEHTDLLSLIISGEEEATRQGGDLGASNLDSGSAGDNLANGHGGDDSEAGTVTPVRSTATSYWSITEGPNQPPLLSLAPGPSGRKPRVQRASRWGLSRIPGRDHRRYYHEYWRSEYLMDFDPERHSMICMVCGSSLATLKLSTIKRHIRQKHPDSLLWSAADKEVIRSGWESHLSLGGGQRSGSGPPVQGEEASMDFGPNVGGEQRFVSRLVLGSQNQNQGIRLILGMREGERHKGKDQRPLYFCSHTHQMSLGSGGAYSRTRENFGGRSRERHFELNRSESVAFSTTKGGNEDAACDVTAPPNDDEGASGERSKSSSSGMAAAAARHGHYPGKDQRRNYQARWRVEYLMDYDGRRHGLICMVCGAALATLKVSTIKRHILQVHPHSLLYGAEEKERTALSYGQSALQLLHSEDCFPSQDPGAPSSPAQLGT
uniref:Zinc finger translocation associated n=1 Tax=Cyprinodon variegatus TaxID=28743 RepID=A0A3Q2D1R6_CYPVA